MDSFDLEPIYSTNQIQGKCIKCVAEQELNNSLRKLLRDQGEDKDLKQRYEMLVAFLKSSDSEKLRIESEKYIAEGKKVKLKLYFSNGIPNYKLVICN